MAKHLDKKVTAKTGLLYAVRNGNKYWFETENGATWQMANADMIEPPEPIQTPSNFLDYKNLKKSFEYVENNSLVNISFDDIIKIEIISANKEKLIISKESYFFFWKVSFIQKLYR